MKCDTLYYYIKEIQISRVERSSYNESSSEVIAFIIAFSLLATHNVLFFIQQHVIPFLLNILLLSMFAHDSVQWRIQGGARHAHSLLVKILSFSYSLQQNICKIIG